MNDSLVAEVEAAVSKGSSEQRVAALRRVAGLFVDQSPRLSDAHIEVFDGVIGQLARQISFSARIALSEQIAHAAKLPLEVSRALALDESADVAVPVLGSAALIDEATLLEVARTRSDAHLAAIARRPEVNEPVSAAVALRGSLRTLRYLAGNTGAHLNDDTVRRLAARSQDDDEGLGRILAARPDIPEQLRARIIDEAKSHARRQLKTESLTADLSDGMLEQGLMGALQRAARQPQMVLLNEDFDAELADCQEMHEQRQLTEERICGWLERGDIKRALAALAITSTLPVSLAARAYSAAVPEPMLFIVRAAQLNWVTYRAFLSARSGQEVTQATHKSAFDSFQHLSISTAQRSVRFMSVRGRLFTEQAAAAADTAAFR